MSEEQAIPEAGGMRPVVQADRDAAAASVEWQQEATRAWDGAWHFFQAQFATGIRGGAWDSHPTVQAFARHREASTVELVEALAGMLEIAGTWAILDGGRNIDLEASSAVQDAIAALANARKGTGS